MTSAIPIDFPSATERFVPERSVLVMVDIQERLLAAMPEADRARVLRSARTLLEAAARLAVPVRVTEQYPRGLGRTTLALAEAAEACGDAMFIEKVTFAATDTPAFEDALPEDRDQLIVFGLEAHICVHQTVRGLREQGAAVAVVRDASASRDPSHAALAEGLWSAVGAAVLPAETLIFDWLRSAEHPAFRDISKLLK